MDRVEIIVIGAGVIGLSIAAELSKTRTEIFVVEKNASFGQETSSRNSEVIHAGIYYPKDSLKQITCIEGRALLYEYCARHAIPHKRIGKLIVAVNEQELKELETLYTCAKENGVDDMRLLSKKETARLEPHVNAEAALYSPSTGILDTHAFMRKLALQFESAGGTFAYNTLVTGIDVSGCGFTLTTQDARGNAFTFRSSIVINCAGLQSDCVAAMTGLNRSEYALKFCKGDYFRVAHSKAHRIHRLVYPVPRAHGAGLGIHATLDMAGSLRLGPDDEYVKNIDYTIDERKREPFYENVKTFLPFIELTDLSPDTSGIRPKLQGPGENFRDFIIKEESDNGIPGLINLIGIESPGLTASLAIAKIVGKMAEK